jgi:hypothetical protein
MRRTVDITLLNKGNLKARLTSTPWRRKNGGSKGLSPRIRNFNTRWKLAVNVTTQPLYPPGNNLQYPLNRRLSGPHSRSRWLGESKNFSSLLEILFCYAFFVLHPYLVLYVPVLHSVFRLYLQHKHPCSWQDSNPQPQQAIGCRPSS